MLREIDQYFLQQDEAFRGCLLFMRDYILRQDKNISEGKMFCYLWVHKKYKMPYLGIVEGGSIDHPDLIQEKRARMKILLLDPAKDVPVRKIAGIMKQVLRLYKK
jgi:hypothetical protein